LTVATPRDPVSVLVLAAGLGKRMRSKQIKLLHPVAGRPMLVWTLEACRALRPKQIVAVVGHQAESVMEHAADACDKFVLQREQRGTGHAVLQALPKMTFPKRSRLLIVNGDLPTLRTPTLRALLTRHRRAGAALTVLTARLEDPSGYGRVLRGADGRVSRIVEDRDADKEQKRVREINCGIYCADPHVLLPVLRRLRPDNAQGEYYLTDAVHRLIETGEKVVAISHNDADEVLGVNDRVELARAGRTLYARKARQLQDAGVTLLDASRTWIDPRARIGRDTVVYPDVQIEGACVLGEDCVVRSGTRLRDTTVGAGTEIHDHSVVLDSTLGERVQLGPFAHLRPGTVLDAGVKVGNFVEVKKSRLREGVKAPHLTYLGDADIGERSNIGAGTITCNYDGKAKHPTVLGKGVFVGSDTQLVAPVEVGDGAYIGAGSTVTDDVPAGALAVSRTRQRNIEGWVERRAAGNKKKKTGGAKRRAAKKSG
jgi:bifunctional UDP-N-acetylglucosamine pyrophosphorylase/glucosamine-1-phosphate N-acetyltransferase